jgi:D-sedoheptulose 7-phosphate isomerase
MMSNLQQKGEVSFDCTEFLRGELREHREAFEATSAAIDVPFAAALAIIEDSLRAGGKLLLFGNGGSAADAQHIAAQLVIRYKSDRAAIAAIALTTDSSALTACGNDLGFDAIFARQIEALARPGDVVVAISTSGNSPNVLAGLLEARRRGAGTVGLTSGVGGKMTEFCDAIIAVPSKGLRWFHDHGCRLVVITNQSGVGRGMFSVDRLDEIHDRFRKMVHALGVRLEQIYYCPHTPEAGCDCRKPQPGLLLRAAAELHFNPADAIVIGNKSSDVDLGRRVGATTILIDPKSHAVGGEPEPDFVAADLAEAARRIERHQSGRRRRSIARK